jgi:hypothetical protein
VSNSVIGILSRGFIIMSNYAISMRSRGFVLRHLDGLVPSILEGVPTADSTYCSIRHVIEATLNYSFLCCWVVTASVV